MAGGWSTVYFFCSFFLDLILLSELANFWAVSTYGGGLVGDVVR